MMTNELIFIVTTLVELVFIVLMMRLGKEGLFAFIVTNIILVSTFGSQLIEVFGLVTNAGNVFYASIFVAANILVERYGRAVGYRSIWIGFASLVLFVLMSQFVVRNLPIADNLAVSDVIQSLFGGVPRLALASMTAYLVAQNLNVWAFDRLRHKPKPLSLGVSNIASASTGQLVDSVIFFSIAFAGTLPLQGLAQAILVGFILKALIAIAGTPVLYMSDVMPESADVNKV